MRIFLPIRMERKNKFLFRDFLGERHEKQVKNFSKNFFVRLCYEKLKLRFL